MPCNDLAHYIRTYSGSLPAEFCRSVIEHFEKATEAQIANGRGVREGLEGSHWVEMDLTRVSAPAVRAYLLDCVERYHGRYVVDLGLTLPVSAPRRMSNLIVKRYDCRSGGRFQPHFDSLGEVCNRYLVFLWYLNDVAEGGETEFLDLGIKVRPEAGKLLIFPPYWMFQHTGCAPVSENKFILSGYLLY